MLGVASGRVRLVPYAEAWKELFEEEKRRLKKAVGRHVISIEHVGSTSIPGLISKPILDIGIAVDDFEAARVTISPIEELGYQFRGEYGIPRRHYFVKGHARTHHIHVLETTSRDWKTLILFRDYLKQHPEAKEAYQNLKQKLAARFPLDRSSYQDGKAALIQQTLEKARSEEGKE